MFMTQKAHTQKQQKQLPLTQVYVIVYLDILKKKEKKPLTLGILI